MEINSSFYRPHRRTTYERWSDAVPPDFRFSVKLPKTITHECALAGAQAEVRQFVAEIAGLGPRLGAVLVQLPPSLAWELRVARKFFALLRRLIEVPIVCEPRHASWFTVETETMLREWRIVRAAADPARHAGAGVPAGEATVAYYRLHGSPRVYYSSYDAKFLRALAKSIRARADQRRETWCVFDNTAAFAAWDNALALQRLLRRRRGS